jgi:copper chaperone NosL
MTTKRLWLGFMALMTGCLFCAYAVADQSLPGHDHQGKGPRPAAQGLKPAGDMRISAGDRCPVCGMFPAKRPKTAAAMQLRNGDTFYFCGNGCLLRAWHQSDTYLGIPLSQIQQMYVQAYFSGVVIDASKAWWVAGSDVIGPMGPALVALQSKKDVEAFRQRHGGRLVFQLAQMDDQLWRQLFPDSKP